MKMANRHSSLIVGLAFVFLCMVASAADLKPSKTDSYSRLLTKTLSQCLTDLKVAKVVSQSDKLKEASQLLIRSSDLNFAISQDEALSKAFNDDSISLNQFEDSAFTYLSGLEMNFKAS
ncbi:MAG: hypothetical protein ACKO0V_04765, partial [bacterium]